MGNSQSFHKNKLTVQECVSKLRELDRKSITEDLELQCEQMRSMAAANTRMQQKLAVKEQTEDELKAQIKVLELQCEQMRAITNATTTTTTTAATEEVYAIVPNETDDDDTRDKIIFVSKDKSMTTKVFNYITSGNLLMLFTLKKIKIQTYNIDELERHYEQVKIQLQKNSEKLSKYIDTFQVSDVNVELKYDLICLEGMINQVKPKIDASKENDKYFNIDILTQVRTDLNDMYIV